MAFKFKDLIIDVLHAGAAGLCGPATHPNVAPAGGAHCGPATIAPKGGCVPATLGGLRCQPASIIPLMPGCVPATRYIDLQAICGPATRPERLVTLATLATLALAAAGDTASGGGAAADLATLKRELQAALAGVEEEERAQPAQAAHDELPATLQEVEDLEHRLKAALAELAEHKKTL
jgi:hypothetical protein